MSLDPFAGRHRLGLTSVGKSPGWTVDKWSDKGYPHSSHSKSAGLGTAVNNNSPLNSKGIYRFSRYAQGLLLLGSFLLKNKTVTLRHSTLKERP